MISAASRAHAGGAWSGKRAAAKRPAIKNARSLCIVDLSESLHPCYVIRLPDSVSHQTIFRTTPILFPALGLLCRNGITAPVWIKQTYLNISVTSRCFKEGGEIESGGNQEQHGKRVALIQESLHLRETMNHTAGPAKRALFSLAPSGLRRHDGKWSEVLFRQYPVFQKKQGRSFSDNPACPPCVCGFLKKLSFWFWHEGPLDKV